MFVFWEADPWSKYHSSNAEIISKIGKYTRKLYHTAITQIKRYTYHFHWKHNLGPCKSYIHTVDSRYRIDW